MQLTFTGNNPSSPQNNNRMDGYTYAAAGNLLRSLHPPQVRARIPRLWLDFWL